MSDDNLVPKILFSYNELSLQARSSEVEINKSGLTDEFQNVEEEKLVRKLFLDFTSSYCMCMFGQSAVVIYNFAVNCEVDTEQ